VWKLGGHTAMFWYFKLVLWELLSHGEHILRSHKQRTWGWTDTFGMHRCNLTQLSLLEMWSVRAA
jgi:hypothetical protein